MEQRLSLVTLAVEDLESTTAFYEDGLEWELGFSNEEVSFFQLNGIVLSLFRRDRFAEELGVSEDELEPGGTALAYNVRAKEEVDAVVELFREAGGRVLVEPREAEWGGYSGYVADPEGHRWEVAWNPAWRIDEAGDAQMDP